MTQRDPEHAGDRSGPLPGKEARLPRLGPKTKQNKSSHPKAHTNEASGEEKLVYSPQ